VRQRERSATAAPSLRAIIGRMSRQQALAIAVYMLAIGCTVRDVAELLRAHPRAVAALLW
jgi:hypothetical protein